MIAMPGQWWLRLAGCVLIVASGVTLVRRNALLVASDSIVGLRLGRDGSCELRMRDQRLASGHIRPGWFASPLMIVLRIACSGQRWPRYITLLSDAAEEDALRRLRIFLRFAIDNSARR